jgi:hypothetical protein
MREEILAAFGAALLCGCGAAATKTGEDAAQAKTPVTPVSGEIAIATGEWRRGDGDGVAALLFTPRKGRPLAALRCDAQLESLLIERMTDAPLAGVDTIKVQAGGESERLPIMWNGASLPVAVATVRLEDPLTDRLARLGQPIEVQLKGEPTLTLPADRRIGTLIEECRQA